MTKPYIKTLDDTSWTLYDIIGPIGTGTQRFVLDFSSGATTFTSMTFEGDISEGTLYFDSTPVVSYPACVWADADYKALTIAGGVDAANPSLLAWFSQYARSTSPSSGDNAISTALYDIVDAIRGGGSDIPDPSTADVGDVLTKGESGLEWAPSEGLPAVSSSDNGKVLGVSNGAWNKVDIHDPVAFTFDIASDGAGNYIGSNFSLTNQQIYDAIDAGKFVYGISSDGTEWLLTEVNRSVEHSSIISVVFTNVGHYQIPNDLTDVYCTQCRTLDFTSSSLQSISWLDIDGSNGQDGQDGQDGTNGVDGFSPIVTITDYPAYEPPAHVISITDAHGTQTTTVYDGVNGSGGGGDIFEVHYGWDGDTDAFVCDKSYADILNALSHNVPVVGTFANVDWYGYLYSVTIDPDNRIVFIGYIFGMADVIRVRISHQSNEKIVYELCSDRPIEFSIECDTRLGFVDQIVSCDLHTVASPDTWLLLEGLIDEYGPSVGRALCAKATVHYFDPVLEISGSVEKEVRYYCDGISDSGSIYTFTFAADDGSSLAFTADISDPSNIVYGVPAAVDSTILPALTAGTSFASYSVASLTCTLYGVINPDYEGRDPTGMGMVVCFPIYPVTQKFIAAALQNLGNDVTITYDSSDDPNFDFALDWIRNPCLIIPTVDETTYDGTQASLYLTRKFYITNYMSEYLEVKFPFNYNDTQFMIDIKNLNITGTGNAAVITVTGNATLA